MEVTLDMLYRKMNAIEKEIHELKGVLISEEEFEPGEREEHERALSEMAAGKEKNWREVAKK